MEYSYRDELYHHGIKGQRWGVRRYQNEDGSLTKAGLRRQKRQENRESYKRGREIAAEKDKIYNEKLNKLRDASSEYKSKKEKLEDLEYIYDLDKHGNEKNPNVQRGLIYQVATEVAKTSHEKNSKQLNELDTKFKEKAEKYTEKKLLAKYGDSYTKDLKRYESTSTGIALASTILLGAGMIAITSLSNKGSSSSNSAFPSASELNRLRGGGWI